MQPLVSLIETPAELAAHAPAWDALAVASGRPYCAPAWMLSWWRNAAPRGARLRAVTMVEDGELVAIAPFAAERTPIGWVCGPLASSVSARTEPLARPGREEDAARAFTAALAAADPRLAAVRFSQIPPDSPWPGLFRSTWPGPRPRVLRDDTVAAPKLGLAGRDFDGFMASLSAKLRANLRRDRRRLEKRGADYKLLRTSEEVSEALAAFARLHHARWALRGGSGVLTPAVERMLADAAVELLGEERFRVFAIRLDGRMISVHLFVAAGGTVGYWLGAFDPEWSRYGPGNQGVLVAIGDALDRGETCMDLGPGEQEYKVRLADDEDMLESVTLVTRTSRYPLAYALAGAATARGALGERLPDWVKLPVRMLRTRRR